MKRLIISLLLLLLLNYSYAQQNADSALFDPVSHTLSDIRFFDNEEALTITLKYDISSFIRTKAKGEYFPAELTIHPTDSTSVLKNIRLKARGNFRRGHCFFPPIFLNFKTDPIEETELAGIKKIKMVTHCSTSNAYQAYVFREFLAYKIYNILTENSFRVRLLNINYIDTGRKERNYEQIGFLLEPMDLLVKRLKGVEVRQEIMQGKNLLPRESTFVALFEYFLGNTDWRFTSGHNMKYIKLAELQKPYPVPVPYDFDHAGFVNTSYSMPQTWSSVEKVTDREYLGYCQQDEENYLQAINLFNSKKEEIIRTIETFEYLDKKNKNQVLKFVDDFFRMAEEPEILIRKLQGECRDLDF
ncbi:hypothetical protein [uncultured Draconibacterium sp.]|uniref:hypothetical protein n=1 Tax=uncultured Draconibacterium sp. TaxID=1573823 RepID=UPI0025E29C68|nr:hypothetical protein [uncultured Draconibacterium sp.]